jgi:Tfp pilus assembly protein PilN
MPARSINLLQREGFEYTLVGKILGWALTIGRAIVILTELVVIVGFLSRFILDRRLNDLVELNQSKRLQIEAQSTFEKQFRSFQDRILSYKSFLSLPRKSEMINEIASYLPAGVILTQLSIQEKSISLSGEALSEGGLAGFVKTLGESKKFINIKLGNVRLGSEGGQEKIFFSLTGEIK